MDESVKNFYLKNANQGYLDQYWKDHLPRHEFIVNRYKLNEIKEKRIAEFGCGLGIMFSLLDKTNEMVGYDGATIPDDKKLCKFNSYLLDLDSDINEDVNAFYHNRYDISMCFETAEHCASPFRLFNNIKKMTKENGDVYISIPDERMTHPVIYYQLFYPHTNFKDFLECMALPVEDMVLFDNGWPSWVFKCKNRPWREKKMRFYKEEEKFRDANLLEVTNL